MLGLLRDTSPPVLTRVMCASHERDSPGNPFFVNAQGFLRPRAPKRMSKLAYTPQLQAAVEAADQARQVRNSGCTA